MIFNFIQFLSQHSTFSLEWHCSRFKTFFSLPIIECRTFVQRLRFEWGVTFEVPFFSFLINFQTNVPDVNVSDVRKFWTKVITKQCSIKLVRRRVKVKILVSCLHRWKIHMTFYRTQKLLKSRIKWILIFFLVFVFLSLFVYYLFIVVFPWFQWHLFHPFSFALMCVIGLYHKQNTLLLLYSVLWCDFKPDQIRFQNAVVFISPTRNALHLWQHFERNYFNSFHFRLDANQFILQEMLYNNNS